MGRPGPYPVPSEPNGYLHLGHAKSICLNFGIAKEFGGKCNLRFDDTNPSKEEVEYVDSIKEDVRWLGFSWDDRLFYASDYFERLYEFAEHLITTGKAYVDDLSAEDIRAYRGSLTEPGKESPSATAPQRRTWTSSGACAPANSPTAPGS
jgi:glutaminyl-tRNA synthetase